METNSENNQMKNIGIGVMLWSCCLLIIALVLSVKVNEFAETAMHGNYWGSIVRVRAESFLTKNGVEVNNLVVGMNGMFHLDISGSEIVDLSLLYGMPIEQLDISRTCVKDITPLSNLHGLKDLDISNTDIADLSPIADLALERLNISVTRVSDLRPLTNMPIKTLYVLTPSISDLTPLRNMNIEVIDFMATNTLLKESSYVLREMQSIRTINAYSHPSQFWSEYDNNMALKNNQSHSIEMSLNADPINSQDVKQANEDGIP